MILPTALMLRIRSAVANSLTFSCWRLQTGRWWTNHGVLMLVSRGTSLSSFLIHSVTGCRVSEPMGCFVRDSLIWAHLSFATWLLSGVPIKFMEVSAVLNVSQFH